MNHKYKIIDFAFYGNIVKLYLGNVTLEKWTGEDWDNDAIEAYCPVDPEHVIRTILIVVNPDKFQVVPFYDLLGNQIFSKNSMTHNKYPFMSIVKNSLLPNEGFWNEDSKRYCLGDIIELKEKIKFIPIGM